MEEPFLEWVLGDAEMTVVRSATVSRGIRRLEGVSAECALIVPDTEDRTWVRAIQRVRKEHRLHCIVLGNGIEEKDALAAGAFDVFDRKDVSREMMARSLRHLHGRIELEQSLERKKAELDWVEETARLGSWQLQIGGKTNWSQGLKNILGDEGRLTGDFSSLRSFIYPEDREIFDAANTATFRQGWPLDFEYRIVTDQDSIRYLHLHRRVEHGQGGQVDKAFGMVRDVTAEREFENFLFKRDAILQVVGKFAEQFLREPKWETGIASAMEALGKAVQVSRTFIFQLGDEIGGVPTATMIHEWTGSAMMPLLGRSEVSNQTFSPVFDRWRSILRNRKVIAGVIRNFPSDERQYFQKTGARSIMIIPVFVGQRWWGFIGLSEHEEDREWAPVEVESLTMAADIFGSAIQRERMEQLLKKANRSAEEAKTIALDASRAKSRFLANMSHEIRTPISGILGMAEMTITTGLTAEQRKNMDMIRDASGALLAIVNDILDLSKIEALKMDLNPEDFDFRALIETTMSPFASEAEVKSLRLHHKVDAEVPITVNGDPDRLAQILRNLVGNAMKFTEKGEIALDVTVQEWLGNRVCLLLTVRDTGKGIEKDLHDTIFESFTQADNSVRKKHQGTGLGLTISRELARMMGGEISVESEPGQGSLFSLTAWFGRVNRAVGKGDTAPISVQHTLHLNLLLAEDNALNQKFLTHFLTLFGHSVTVAGNGREALEILEKNGRKFDLVLMDIQMPEMGGMEATRAIRESNGRHYDATLPIIALTAYAMKGDKERMLAAGMDDYVSKPVDMKELSAAIARSVAHRDRGRKKVPSFCAPVNRAQKTKPVHLDMESLVERFDGNMPLLKEILELFLTESEEKLVVLQHSLAERNLVEVGAVLHSISNIASHVLAMEIVTLSLELEKGCSQGEIDTVMDGVARLRPRFESLVEEVRRRLISL